MSNRMKKDMSLLMLLMSVLSFIIMPTSVYAQSADYCTATGTLEPCPNCPKYQLWHIPTTCAAVPQGGSSVNPIFDWDATYGYCEQKTATGYLGYPGTGGQPGTIGGAPNAAAGSGSSGGINIVNNKLIMNICCCPDACDFEEGWVVGIEIEILTKGVYWATDPNVPLFDPAVANCYGGGNDLGDNCLYGLTFSRWNKGTTSALHTAPCSNSYQPVNSLVNETDNVDTMKIAYYNSARQLTTQGATPTSSSALPCTANGGAKILRTPTPYDGYELTSADIAGNFCDFWFDVPAMIAYSSEVTAGATVQIKAKLLVSPPYMNPYNEGGVDTNCDDLADGATFGGLSYLRPAGDPGIVGTAGTATENDPPRCQAIGAFVGTGWLDVAPVGIVDANDTGCEWTWPQSFCPECQSPCSCTKDVGIICCTESVTPVSSCIYFPYVLSGLMNNSGVGWVTGIGLSRICDPATGSNPEVSLTLTSCEGVDYTATAPFNYCLGETGMTIDGMISDLTWTPEIPDGAQGQWVLRVNANFVIDGYQFNYNNLGGGAMFGAGVLPRQSCPCQ